MIYTGDALKITKTLPSESVHCVVTSPPYYGLRDYGVAGQIGLEATPEEYISRLVQVFDEVKRVLRGDGTLWLNLGDSYYGSGKGAAKYPENAKQYKQSTNRGTVDCPNTVISSRGSAKNLMGIPWRVALALQADGWNLRQDIIWAKPNPMPESATDRCTKSHEYIFLLSKNRKYYFDAKAISEPVADTTVARCKQDIGNQCGGEKMPEKTPPMKVSLPRYGGKKYTQYPDTFFRTKSGGAYDIRDGRRNKRSVWTVSTVPFKEAHFATFPPESIRPCILAGCPVGETVLDPFFGAGTVGVVCCEESRKYIGIEINPRYVEIAKKRCAATERSGRLVI
ncbi:MAG: site-specific DNA-methyltransferase [Synergistaceae bacterium]|nr:site-specific DNA-methyltransferase [Synergistaceae bacterium]